VRSKKKGNKGNKGNYSIHVISAPKYLHHCTSDDGPEKMSAMMHI
jgi:hypothetical protein